MPYSSIIVSSGHGLYVRGASGMLDEVDEARKVTERLALALRNRGVRVVTFHDNISKNQNTNLNTIVNFHNSQVRDLDVSIHFNAHQPTAKPMGTECLYLTQPTLAADISAAIAKCGFINRGAKKRTDLFFLNKTKMPAVLLEICFVDSESDADKYLIQLDAICENVADVLGGKSLVTPIPPVDPEEPGEPDAPSTYLFQATGKCSYFGGPDDTGVSADEGLAFIYDIDDAPQLFLPYQPEGTSGLARRLNPFINYVACRWDYSKTPKPSLLDHVALVRSTKTGIALKAFCADWGPHQNTGRVADLSPGLMDSLGIETDDEVEVVYPYTGDV